ncbi:glycosyltransferase [Asticcacaulis machinosus]|uniref:Glycosyltransferase n=1 Tax=Asticcacaulis machinosus TaxID=2984211 RepID=A0ABT5HJL7_9CAUL|nr:glycosyltransferase [Asticcacaulis machinosus]MDC7676439.1 glycosyltransferase [Asticcacaulis machinosus]
MFISVIMCTRNRAEQLRRVLETAAAMTVPNGLEWEMVLVDNGSSDHTAEVVSRFSDRIPIRYVLEAKAGLSNARNRGVAEAAGEYICWTDDDVLIDPNWLSAYADAFQRHPEATVFGGVIEPVTEIELPKWWQDNRELLASVLAARDFGPDEVELSVEEDRLPYGANYALRADEQRRHLYDPGLGVGPQHKRLGEEVAVIRAVMAEGGGGGGVWVPGARVRHIIPAARLTQDYVGSYYRSVGETWAYLSQAPAHARHENFMGKVAPVGRRHFQNVPLWIWSMAAQEWWRDRQEKMKGHTSLYHWLQYNYYAGAITYFRAHKEAK